MRLYDSQCKECKAYAIINGYCRECGEYINTKDTDASDQQTDSEWADESDEQNSGEIEHIDSNSSNAICKSE